MRTHVHALTFVSSVLALAACGGGGVTDDGGASDLGRSDGGGLDSGPIDGGGVDMTTPPVDGGGIDMTTPPVDMGGTDSGPPPACVDPVLPALSTVELVPGMTWNRPMMVLQSPGDDTTFYVVEQRGRVRRVVGTTVTTFLDISTTIGGTPSGGEERGLLGMAFHPGYATNGRFFLGYTPLGGAGAGHNVVAEYHRNAADPTIADPTEVHQLVSTTDPEGNHNGGWVGFGPDGFLYAAIGDGGGGCDAHGTNGNGQSKTTLLAKMLRLDVDNTAGAYAAAGNPFSGSTGLPQIWAYGLRNPWRNSFDRLTGDLWMGDVGQGAWEEIDFQAAGTGAGLNYGWETREGRHPATDSCPSAATPDGTLTEPIYDYAHGTHMPIGGVAVTGGYVYRGAAIPAIQGVYFFADYGSGNVAALRYCESTLHGPVRSTGLTAFGYSVTSFGEDNAGELYICDLGGSVVRIIPG